MGGSSLVVAPGAFEGVPGGARGGFAYVALLMATLVRVALWVLAGHEDDRLLGLTKLRLPSWGWVPSPAAAARVGSE